MEKRDFSNYDFFFFKKKKIHGGRWVDWRKPKSLPLI
jgi:hypothetical protein